MHAKIHVINSIDMVISVIFIEASNITPPPLGWFKM